LFYVSFYSLTKPLSKRKRQRGESIVSAAVNQRKSAKPAGCGNEFRTALKRVAPSSSQIFKRAGRFPAGPVPPSLRQHLFPQVHGQIVRIYMAFQAIGKPPVEKFAVRFTVTVLAFLDLTVAQCGSSNRSRMVFLPCKKGHF
jgi:hypothetical protein